MCYFFHCPKSLHSNCTVMWLGAGSWSLGGLKILVVVFRGSRRLSRGWSLCGGVRGGLEHSPGYCVGEVFG